MLKSITEESKKLKNKLLLNKYDENQKHVNWFKNIKIDLILKYVSPNGYFNYHFYYI